MSNSSHEYKLTLTTFFDILGFRAIVENMDPSLIHDILESMRKESMPDSGLQEMLEINAIAFSDSIVRSAHLLSESNLRHPSGLLFFELLNLAFVQSQLVYDKGVFLRGAITTERLFLQDGIVFGPALVRAYQLESSAAIYPRILVDDAAMEAFEQLPEILGVRHHDYPTGLNHVKSLTCVDFDGQRFVDYLASADNEFSQDYEILDVFDKHFERVSAAAKEAQDTPSVLSKYHWVASYHNSVVARYSDEFFNGWDEEKARFILDDTSVPNFSTWTNAPPVKD